MNRGQQNQLKSAVQNPPGEAGIELSILKAKDEARKAFVLQYRQIREEAQESGAKIFFVDEAHFRADAAEGEMGAQGRFCLLLLGSLWKPWK